MRRTVLTAAAVFALDQITKWAVVWQMDLAGRGVIEVAPPFLTFRMAWNRGVNFGLFAGEEATRWALTGLALAISVWVLIWIRREGGAFAQLSAGLLTGGALGNAADRVLYGAVADFLNMSCCGIENPYAFNLADIAIFAGAAGLVLSGGKTPGRRGRRP